MKSGSLKIFLSYAHEDRKTVQQVYKRLRKEGFSPWMDVENLLSGQDWTSEIENAIQNSDVVLVFLSAKSVNKEGFVQREIRRSLELVEKRPEGTIFFIAVKLDDSPSPYVLKAIQNISYTSATFWKKLIDTLKSREMSIYGKKREYVPIIDAENILISNRAPALEPIIKRDRGRSKKQIFIAMPFSANMEDTYYYGIQRAVDVVGYESYRSDKKSFVGDILLEIKLQLVKSIAVVADLTSANPNVYLEVGYAWGNGKPTILIMKKGHKPRFDVQGQKYLEYNSIKHLEEILTKELIELKANGVFGKK